MVPLPLWGKSREGNGPAGVAKMWPMSAGA